MRKFLLAALVALLALPAWAQAPAPATPATRAAPAAKPAAAGVATPGSTGKVDVNAATEQQLDALPGVGPARAKAIIAGRPYAELQDLVKKKALTQAVFDKAKGGMALANINTSSAAEMESTLPGIGDMRSRAILAGRPYASPQDLVGKGVLTQALFDRIKDVIAF